MEAHAGYPPIRPTSIVQLCRLVLTPRHVHFKRDFHFGETNMATRLIGMSIGR
jgi:hypothetical protein